jgi:hypothetical protein
MMTSNGEQMRMRELMAVSCYELRVAQEDSSRSNSNLESYYYTKMLGFTIIITGSTCLSYEVSTTLQPGSCFLQCTNETLATDFALTPYLKLDKCSLYLLVLFT